MTKKKIERVVQFAQQTGFMTEADLDIVHCDALEAGALQNGDVETIGMIDRARRNWPGDRYKVFAILCNGYKVYENDAPKI